MSNKRVNSPEGVAGQFQALADPTRLRLINLMDGGEICVCYFTEILGEPQPKISRHLAYLRRAGLVEVRRDGKWMHYRLADPGSNPVLEKALTLVRAMPELQRDRAALSRFCCATKLPESIREAPRPVLRAD